MASYIKQTGELPAGLTVRDYINWRYRHCDIASLEFDRRHFLIGGSAAAASGLYLSGTKNASANVAGLINLAVAFVTLASEVWDLYQRVTADIGLDAEKVEKTTKGELDVTVFNRDTEKTEGGVIHVVVVEPGGTFTMRNAKGPKLISAGSKIHATSTARDRDEKNFSVSA